MRNLVLTTWPMAFSARADAPAAVMTAVMTVAITLAAVVIGVLIGDGTFTPPAGAVALPAPPPISR